MSRLIPCNFGSRCNRQDNSSHVAKFSHPNAARTCNFGSRCCKQHDPAHTAYFSHPPSRSTSMQHKEVVAFENMGHVVGANNRTLELVEKASGAVCERVNGNIVVHGETTDQVHVAMDLLCRCAEMGQSITRKLVFSDYSSDEMIRFIKPHAKLRVAVGYGAGINDPYILSKESVGTETQHKFTQQFQDFFQQMMQKYENSPGHLKFQARYGKSVFFKLSDEAKNQALRADTLVKHEHETSKVYRTSFTTGVSVHDDLHQHLEAYGEPKIQETYNFKTIARHEGKYHTIQVNLYVDDDGKLVCDKISGKENKVCVDQASMDQAKLDIRISLQFSDIIQEDHFLFPYAQELVNNTNLAYENGEGVLSFIPPPNMFVYTIRHKQSKCYTHEGNFKIDVSEIRMVDYQHKTFEELAQGVQRAALDKQKTEVELSYIPWRKAFKYNKLLAGGNIGEHVKQKLNPSEWSAANLCKELNGIIDEAVSISHVICNV